MHSDRQYSLRNPSVGPKNPCYVTNFEMRPVYRVGGVITYADTNGPLEGHIEASGGKPVARLGTPVCADLGGFWIESKIGQLLIATYSQLQCLNSMPEAATYG